LQLLGEKENIGSKQSIGNHLHIFGHYYKQKITLFIE